MRGTPSPIRSQKARAGIIPAYAGNTTIALTSTGGRRDHPRICGEHQFRGYVFTGSVGSSPHMRGTRITRCSTISNLGIIPAYAGNTRPAWKAGRPPRDHPRICGEHISSRGNVSTFLGSSPHMRGTRIRAHGYVDTAGIIPAYAGNTAVCNGSSAFNRDHPRICGEHFLLKPTEHISEGSSPHMRGTH